MNKVLSGNNKIDGLLWTDNRLSDPVLSWQSSNSIGSSVSLTYGFLNYGENGYSNFLAMNSGLKSATRKVLEQFEQVANIKFTETTSSSADIQFGTANLGGSPSGFTAGVAHNSFQFSGSSYASFSEANVYLTNASFAGYGSASPGSAAFNTLVHEVGHALGLDHPHEGTRLASQYDSTKYSVMSYNDFYEYGTNPAGLMLLDILALQYLYGKNTSYKSGNTTIDLKSFVGDGPRALWDGGGTDTIDMSRLSKGETLSLIEGRYSSIFAKDDFVIAYGARIENAKGTNYSDKIYGTAGKNTLWGLSGNDSLVGYGGNDTLFGSSGDDTLRGDGGNDKIYTGSGADKAYLGDGNDYVLVGGGKEYFDGGSGHDYISYYSSSGGITINLAANTVSGSWAVNDTINSFESVSGSKTGSDKIYGTGGTNIIKTYGGNDKVFAGNGADKVYLGDGNDYAKVGGGKEHFDGGSGWDYISYYDSTGGVTVNLAANKVSGSWAVNDTIKSFEGVSGSKTGGDTIYGTGGGNSIRTYGGNDKVYAGNGSDKVYLGSGNDYVKVGGGQEYFDGGSGHDYVSYYDSTGGVTVDLAANKVSGSWAVNDTIKSFESVSGSKTGGDRVYGTGGANTIKTYGGNDFLAGRAGNDRLYGGSGADTFHFDKGGDRDTIKDFQNNVDTIELDNFSFASGKDAFDFASQVGSNVEFDFGGGDVLIVEGVTIGQLTNDLEMV